SRRIARISPRTPAKLSASPIRSRRYCAARTTATRWFGTAAALYLTAPASTSSFCKLVENSHVRFFQRSEQRVVVLPHRRIHQERPVRFVSLHRGLSGHVLERRTCGAHRDDPAREGKLVHVSGAVKTTAAIADDIFPVQRCISG